jgi:hypothetical protein
MRDVINSRRRPESFIMLDGALSEPGSCKMHRLHALPMLHIVSLVRVGLSCFGLCRHYELLTPHRFFFLHRQAPDNQY